MDKLELDDLFDENDSSDNEGVKCTGYIESTGRCDIDNMPCDMCATVHVKFGQ